MRKLPLWQDLVDPPAVEAPAPTLAEAGFVLPMPNGERRRCGNCAHRLPSKIGGLRCTLHDPRVRITATHICTRHLGGEPALRALVNVETLQPELTRLRPTQDGISCDSCGFFAAQGATGGRCEWTRSLDGVPLPSVPALGACNRWQAS